MKNSIPVLASLVAAFILAHCAKDVNYTVPVKTAPGSKNLASFGSIEEFQVKNQPTLQVAYINAAKETTLTFKENTSLSIPAGAFTLNGVPITQGLVKVEVRELTKRSAMVLSGISTQTNDNLLESAGMMELQASLNSQKLEVNSSKPPVATFAAGTNRNFNDFGSFAMNPQTKNWEFDDAKVEVFADNGQMYFRMPVRQCGWINCDRFYHYNPSYDIPIKVPKYFENNCHVFVVVHYLRSCVKLYWDDAKKEYNVTSKGYAGFPDTLTVTAVCEGLKDGEFVSCETTFKMAKGIILNMEPKPENEDDFKSRLAAKLDNL